MDGTYVEKTTTTTGDGIERGLLRGAYTLIVCIFGFVPIFFIPSLVVPLEYSKTLFVVVGLIVALVLWALATLRSGTMRVTFTPVGYALLAVGATGLISGLLSEDRFDALVGNTLDVGTVGFTAVLCASVLVPLVIGFPKTMVVRVYMLLGGSAMLLALYHLVRILFGPGLLDLGVFPTLVATPYGGWNSIGLFFGLVILLSLIALEQLPLTRWGKVFFAVVSSLSLLMLVVINFFAIWVVLGLVGLVVVMYGLIKDRFVGVTLARETQTSGIGVSLALAGVLTVVSIVMLLGGTSLSTFISERTGVSFLEVRPSLGATLDITRSVYGDYALLGVGPNRFVDAWRAHKDPAINTSVFWSVDFTSGYSYFATIVATWGILGAVAHLAFLVLFVWCGLQVVLRPRVFDAMWYFIGTSSFAAGMYLWGMAFVYTPGIAHFVLAGFFTSALCASYAALRPLQPFVFSIIDNRRAAIVMVGVVMVFIVTSVGTLYGVSRHFASVVTFNSALAMVEVGTPIADVEGKINDAFTLSQNDLFARQVAEYQLVKINSLLGTTEPTETEQQAFEAAIAQGVVTAQQAIALDGTESRNWAVLGAIYSVLAGIGIEDTKNRASEAFQNARQYDPQNPVYSLLEAQLAARTGDVEGARNAARAASILKPNYTEALLLLTELDVAEGNVGSAIETTRAVISIEPQNPARYFQLGVLYLAQGSTSDAIASFESAVTIDTNYANARYFLARLYSGEGNQIGAREQLEAVAALNPDNAEVRALLETLAAGGTIGFTDTPRSLPIPEGEVSEDSAVTAPTDPDTPLVTPVNIGGSDATEPVSESDESTTEPIAP